MALRIESSRRAKILPVNGKNAMPLLLLLGRGGIHDVYPGYTRTSAHLRKADFRRSHASGDHRQSPLHNLRSEQIILVARCLQILTFQSKCRGELPGPHLKQRIVIFE